MAGFNKLHGVNNEGFDPSNFWQVVPVGRSSQIYLEGGDDLTAECSDDSVASVTSISGEGLPLKRITVTGRSVGATSLLALNPDGTAAAITPLQLIVAPDPNYRLAGSANRPITSDARLLIPQDLREAV